MLKEPNKPVPLSGLSSVNKAHNMVNNNVREGTDWKMWCIFANEGCAKGQLKLVIGSITMPSTSKASKDISYVTSSQFDEFKKELNNRLHKIEETLTLHSFSDRKPQS